MTFTHSPGPWSLAEREGNLIELDSPKHAAIATIVVAMQDGTNKYEERQLRGNAQLLKHSLAMYEQLKRLKSYLSSVGAPAQTLKDITQLLQDIETVPVSREEMLTAVVNDLVDSLSTKKDREAYLRTQLEELTYEQLVKAYNDMQVLP